MVSSVETRPDPQETDSINISQRLKKLCADKMRTDVRCRPFLPRRRMTIYVSTLHILVLIVVLLSDYWPHEGPWMVFFGVEAFVEVSTSSSTRIRQDGGNSQIRGDRNYVHLSLSAPFFSERTSVKPNEATVTTPSSISLPPAYVIERISNLPTNDRLFERISSMCIDVFFKEQLLESSPPPINGNSNPKKGKL
jgi:hypothetical protein